MLAYLFWHAPQAAIEAQDYEAALLDFQASLAGAPPPGLAACAAYLISSVPWVDDQRIYEDWYLVRSSADLDALNEAAVCPQRWDVHAAIAGKMRFGHGGLYRHLHGDEQPLAGTRAVWLTRPRGIRYEDLLRDMAYGRPGFLSSWRRQMVLGPGDEFVVIGTSRLEISPSPGWQARTAERARLARSAPSQTRS
ncbi:MAG: hypothetical protein JO366_08370 [Methylobacteriaceae bacterium]|nr:hypothetical protein [Methylobacteriaceae bacterium]MBV9222141.1 hypothetical protein [Methylobacteriaceae bacterium]MBV9244813.1 hypothetical protein [Methylobacteriaceae bacterium]MBV9636131.1 hypothetical protein [Methylobacteriaceae bacterium]MBV9703099.1 hypothetical protein [Methylobacteriaceae bacterium]